MPLVNCKIHLELYWIQYLIWDSTGGSGKTEIIDAELHVSKVTLSTKDNVNLTKQLNDGYKRSAHWNSYYTIPEKVLNNGTKIYELLSASFQGAKKLFVCA